MDGHGRSHEFTPSKHLLGIHHRPSSSRRRSAAASAPVLQCCRRPRDVKALHAGARQGDRRRLRVAPRVGPSEGPVGYDKWSRKGSTLVASAKGIAALVALLATVATRYFMCLAIGKKPELFWGPANAFQVLRSKPWHQRKESSILIIQPERTHVAKLVYRLCCSVAFNPINLCCTQSNTVNTHMPVDPCARAAGRQR